MIAEQDHNCKEIMKALYNDLDCFIQTKEEHENLTKCPMVGKFKSQLIETEVSMTNQKIDEVLSVMHNFNTQQQLIQQ